ncbi:MAG: arginase family protein, partial [Flavobacteriaceae bacterium]|nr:arginase family protein [Flavobacteriaceae bacterium]
EPGGLLWYETLDFLRQVFEEKNVVGFDIVELCPNKDEKSSDFLVAKLYYKMLSYKFLDENIDDEYDNNYESKQKNNSSKYNEDDEY